MDEVINFAVLNENDFQPNKNNLFENDEEENISIKDARTVLKKLEKVMD